MKKMLLLTCLTVLLACQQNTKPIPLTLLEADKAFCKLNKEKGMKTAFLAWADNEVIKMDNKSMPIIGKAALAKALEGPDDFNLSWEPLKAEISQDIGYTFGNWTYSIKTKDNRDSLLTGCYVTIWKKQSDGSWKFVLDTGTSTPGVFKL